MEASGGHLHKTQIESGLYIGKKLTREHIHLTSYSWMRVDLAAQVMDYSNSIVTECMSLFIL